MSAYEALQEACKDNVTGHEVVELQHQLRHALESVGILTTEKQTLDQQFTTLMGHFRSASDELQKATGSVASLWKAMRGMPASHRSATSHRSGYEPDRMPEQPRTLSLAAPLTGDTLRSSKYGEGRGGACSASRGAAGAGLTYPDSPEGPLKSQRAPDEHAVRTSSRRPFPRCHQEEIKPSDEDGRGLLATHKQATAQQSTGARSSAMLNPQPSMAHSPRWLTLGL